MSVILLGVLFFKGHDWRTRDRLRASLVRAVEIVVGKCLPAFGLSLLQLGDLA